MLPSAQPAASTVANPTAAAISRQSRNPAGYANDSKRQRSATQQGQQTQAGQLSQQPVPARGASSREEEGLVVADALAWAARDRARPGPEAHNASRSQDQIHT